MKVYVVTYEGKACYDASGIFHGVFASREAAEESLSGYDREGRVQFLIEEYEI